MIMPSKQNGRPYRIFDASLVLLCGLITLSSARISAAQAPGPQTPPPPPTAGAKLEIIGEGSSASYRVTEQFVGVTFTNEAVGTTNLVAGTLTILPDGNISPDSKLTVDLRGLKSDQDMRDGAVQSRVLETDKYPYAEFVPTKVQGLEKLIPSTGQAGVSLTGNLTVHGVTKETTFQGIATFNPRNNTVAGRAKATITFAQFGLKPPKIARLASLDDKLDLELIYRFKRSLP
jgi:polyisoprenoid-binding protein YceI